MNILLLLVFVSFMFVFAFAVLYAFSIRNHDLHHTEQLALLPLEDDYGDPDAHHPVQ